MAHLEIGLFDAKTHLSEYVERAAAGEEFIITRRGKEMARLVPSKKISGKAKRSQAMQEILKIRESYTGPPVSWAEIVEWKNSGRRDDRGHKK